MPGADEISTRVALTGEKEYRDELKAIAEAQKVLSSETAKATAAFDRNDKSVEALTARNDGLNKKLDLQRQKVETCRKALENAVKAWGEADSRTQKWQKELNYAEAAVTKTEQAVRKNTEAMAAFNAEVSKKTIQEFSKGMETAAGRLDSLGNKLTMGLTAPLAAAGAASVNFASDTEEAVNKVEVAFGGAADSIRKWSDTTLTSIGLAKGTALDMAALYGDMATSMGFADGQAAEMSKTLVNLAADLSSFKNISIDMSNTALKSIFTGETESLKGLGIVMTQTNLEAYAMAQGFQTAYKDMDQAQQVAVRYQYVLDQTKNAQGDFSRTFDGTANQLRVFQESLKEAAATAGEELLPVITPIISNLSELVQSFGDLDEGTRKAVVQAGLFLAALGPMLKLTGGVTSAVNAGVTAYTALKTAIATTTGAQAGLNAAMSANPVGAVVTAVGSLVAVLSTLALTSALMSDRTDDLNKRLKESTRAYEERRAAIREENADTLAAVSTLEVLAATEQKTAAQKAAMAELVDELNESVPGLTLAYDAQTDSLNMTTEALRGLVEAETQRQLQEEAVGRMVELKKDEARITAELTEAQTGLARVEAELVSIAAQYEKLGGESYAERHISAYKTASAEAGKYRAQIETLTGTLEDARRETADVEEEYRTYSVSASQAAGAAEGLAEQTEAVGRAAAGTGEKVSELASSLDGAAKSYSDVTDAEAVGVSTAIKLQEEYAKLVDENADLLEQYPELYAALDANNTVQENSAEIAKSVWGIRRQLLIDELEAQAENIRGQITNLQTMKDTAIDTYETIARAALLANDSTMLAKASITSEGGAALAHANRLLGRGAKEEVEDTSAAARDLQNQLNGVLAQLEKLRNSTVDTYVVGSTSSKTSKSGSKKEKDAAMAALDEWLAEMDHKLYLWGKEGGREAAIAGAYRDMQEAVHALAEEYRAKGYDETSEEIQQLQKLWWGYADALEQQNQEAYSRELSALEEALGNEEITWEEYLAGRRQAQADHLREGTQAWKDADREIEEETKRHHEELVKANEAAYDEELDDLKYYRDMDMVTEEQFYVELAELRDKYLEENSDKWRSATVELHNYLEKCREEELEAAKKAYDKQLKELDNALSDRLDAVKTSYNAEVDAIKAAYSEEVSALKKKFSEEKTALKEGYDQAKTAAKEAYDAQKEAAKAAYEEKKKAVQEELKLEKDRLNAVLEGIDAEIQARRELREDEDLDAKIAAARKRLEAAEAQREYARTDEDRAEWDKEVDQLKKALEAAIRDKEDTEFYREKEEEKEAVREQITAAGEKADAALEGLKSAYDAQVKELDGAYKVKVRELESQYKADLSALEARQEHELAAAKQTYEENLARAKADYERRVKEAKADYERDKSRLERDRESAEKGINDKYDRAENQGGGREYSDEVRAIARKHDVDLGVAQDMYNNDQRHKGEADYVPYGGSGSSAGKAVAAAAGAIGAAVAGMVTSVGRSVQNNVRNNASVTINQASSLTEGQVARTVRKVLDEMGR